mgnify:FL=1
MFKCAFLQEVTMLLFKEGQNHELLFTSLNLCSKEIPWPINQHLILLTWSKNLNNNNVREIHV